WVYQINGFDKTTLHKENGFIFNAESLDSACELGQEYSQDSIYTMLLMILFMFVNVNQLKGSVLKWISF
ncbi:hypothetical protein NAI31_10070, partial [Francisella tularensis subsp. holarctica]|uniref:hypothetical protein n=1 Tax=Francisella tularensis TaxID=263 RepID=UPI002381BBA4